MRLARMILWIALCAAPWCTADTQAALDPHEETAPCHADRSTSTAPQTAP